MAADTLFCPRYWTADEPVSAPGFRLPDFGVRAGETFLIQGHDGLLPLVRRLPVQPAVVMAGTEFPDADLLARVRPDRIVMPLIGLQTDAHDTLTTLDRLGFRGRACVISGPLPRVALVLAELQDRAPRVELHLIALTQWPGLFRQQSCPAVAAVPRQHP